MEPLLKVAEKRGVPIIEDCCHTLMSQYGNQLVGTFGVGGYYSFEWGKPVVAGIGGALNVNDLELRKKIKQQYVAYGVPSAKVDFRIRIQSMAHTILYRPSLFWPVRSLYHALGKIGAAESNYNPIEPGRVAEDFSLKMSTYGQKKLGRKIGAIDKITEHSGLISTEYAAQITSPLVEHVAVSEKCSPVYCRYPLLAENKKSLLESAKKANVEMAEWYATPVHPLQGKELELVDYHVGECPNAEARCEQIVTLPTHPAVRGKDVERTVLFFNNDGVLH
jgi:dTDP-4-amino-4,6-dideoxygalactose transaminase